MLLFAWLSGPHSTYTQLGVFFSKMAVVTFGGAYAVLTYVAQQAVERFAWVTPAQMLDGLGLAESTPGPLILVVQFVGFLAAYQAAGSDHPMLAGVVGAMLTVWVTFVPCFLWIFLGAPYIEALRGNAALASALAAITAAVVGVIANLALWFASHVLFAKLGAYGVPGMVDAAPGAGRIDRHRADAAVRVEMESWPDTRELRHPWRSLHDARMTGTGLQPAPAIEPNEVTSYLPQSLFNRFVLR